MQRRDNKVKESRKEKTEKQVRKVVDLATAHFTFQITLSMLSSSVKIINIITFLGIEISSIV